MRPGAACGLGCCVVHPGALRCTSCLPVLLRARMCPRGEQTLLRTEPPVAETWPRAPARADRELMPLPLPTVKNAGVHLPQGAANRARVRAANQGTAAEARPHSQRHVHQGQPQHPRPPARRPRGGLEDRQVVVDPPNLHTVAGWVFAELHQMFGERMGLDTNFATNVLNLAREQ